MSTIESILTENRIFKPSQNFTEQANLSEWQEYKKLLTEADSDYEGFWARMATENIDWNKPFSKILNSDNPPFFRWFEDGELNVSWNCLDRHLTTQPNKVAIIFESDDGNVTRITYKQLYHRVCQLSNGLSKELKILPGDRVIIYMPMSIEAVVAMQACARIGATHSVVFGGFSAKSLQDRIIDAGANCVITADGGIRNGKEVFLKNTVDEALGSGGCECVKHVVVYQRTKSTINMDTKKDIWMHDLVQNQPDVSNPVWVSSEHPLFILYTSGSTGKPKGVQHSSGGYLLQAQLTMKWSFDYKQKDIFWCTADVGWVTGHTYIAYGPLAVGATQVIFEGVPTYPDANRFWQMIANHSVTVFYTAPTAIRSLIKLGKDLPKQHNLTSLRLLGSVGEPINPEAWVWYHSTVGSGKCPIVDTWWQTETGGHMITPLPGITPLKPGSCTLPLPGIVADVVDESGESVEKGKGGILVIKKPWPSMIRNIWGDPERFKKTYFPDDFDGKYYLAGDGANRDADGYYWIMGRIDDVLVVSGHNLGTMEIESALVAHPLVAEAAVVGKPDNVKGETIVAFVVLQGDLPIGDESDQTAQILRNWVTKQIGPVAKPEEIRFGDNLPKTRSGKIMRRLLRSIAKDEEITQDTSTLENPSILEQLKKVR